MQLAVLGHSEGQVTTTDPHMSNTMRYAWWKLQGINTWKIDGPPLWRDHTKLCQFLSYNKQWEILMFLTP